MSNGDYHKMDDYSMDESTSDSEVEMRRLLQPLHLQDDNKADGKNAETTNGDDGGDGPLSQICSVQCLRGGGGGGSKESRSKVDGPLPGRYLQNDVEEVNIQEQLFSALNQIEDDLDEHAYKDIIPLSIRIQLENQVFGWTHLCSIFLGHLFYTLSAYFGTFWIISYFGLKHITAAGGGADDGDDDDGTHNTSPHSFKGCAWQCFIDKIFYARSTTAQNEYEPIMGLPHLVFIAVRTILSLLSALSAFRTVRRRTMVWLNSPTSKKTRKSVMETDRTTLLGRIRSGLAEKRNHWLTKRKERKIKKASFRFERRHERRRTSRRKLSDGIAQFEEKHHDRVLQLGKRSNSSSKPRISIIGSHNKLPDDSSSSNRSSSLNADNAHDSSSRRRIKRSQSMSCGVLDPGDFLETFQKYENRSHKRHNKSTHFTGHTMPASVMKSVLQDQIRFRNGLVHNVPYAHGGYFGAAPFMLANPHWINILRCLMPDVYVEISQRVEHAPIPKLIHWAENNPVMAAYGTAHDLEYHGKVPTLEWDVFLDPHLVQRTEIVLDARNEILDRLQNTSKKTAAGHKRFSERTSAVEKFLTPHELSILGFFNTEIKKRVNVLVENMLIAHGNLLQLVTESTGYLKRYNFSRVRHMRRTLGGGITSKKWITTYVEALRMSTIFDDGLLSDDDDSLSENSPSRLTPDSSPSKVKNDTLDETVSLLHNMDSSNLNDAPFHKQKASQKAIESANSNSIAQSISDLKRIMNCEAPLGLLLDLKSRHVPKRIWALVIDALREAGARVEGIGSFVTQEIRDISQLCSAPVRELVLVHTAGDLQKACHDGSIRRGESIFLNGGSLFYNYSGLKDISSFINVVTTSLCKSFDTKTIKKNYRFESFARVARKQVSDGELDRIPESSTVAKNSDNSSSSSDENVFPVRRTRSEKQPLKFKEGYGSTIEQYKDYFDLSIGLYVQEFAIDERSIDLLVRYVNENSHVFNLGLGWGGINGVTVRGIQPGRFTHTDGLWNQRYLGHRWDTELFPSR